MSKYARYSAVLLLAMAASGQQQPFLPAPHEPVAPQVPQPAQWHSPAVPRSMVGGLWRTDANFKSTIYLSSSVETSTVSVTPVLWLSNGGKYTLPPVALPPAGVATVDINQALQEQGIAAWATLSGYVEIDYSWPWDALCVTVVSVDTVHSEIFGYSLRVGASGTAAAQPQALAGLWWKQESNVAGFVALTNVSSQPLNVSLQVSDSADNQIGTHAVTIPPHEMNTVDLKELQTALTTDGGISVSYQGSIDDLILTGGLGDPATGYSATIPFQLIPQSGSSTASITYAELGLMTGAADPMMKFPAGKTFTPYTVVRNTSGAAVSITPVLHWMKEGSPHRAALPAISLAPYHSQNLSVPSMLASALGNFNGQVNLALQVEGPAGAVLIASGSVDQKSTYVFTVQPMGVVESESRSLSYWSTGRGNDTMVTLWNPADEAQNMIFKLTYTGGHYLFPVQLGPKSTHMFNISEIVNSGVPDAEGNVIPVLVNEGAAMVYGSLGENQRILVAMDSGVYNVQKATCQWYCINCNGETSAWASPDPFGVPTGSNTQVSFMAQYNTGVQYNQTSLATWSSSNTGIATVSGGLVRGVSPGSVQVNSNYLREVVAGQSCGAPAPPCPILAPVPVQTPGNVAPVITSISPAKGVAGGSTTVTISGTGFGSSPTVSVSGGVTATVNSASNTQITATITVPGTTPGGNQNLTVTAQAIQSLPVLFMVLTPKSLKVVSATNLGCTGSHNYGIQIDVLYQVLDQSGQPLQVAGLIPWEQGTFLTGGNVDQQLGAATDASGTFHDTPLGVCSAIPIPGLPLTNTQNISMHINTSVFPVRTQHYTLSAPAGAAGFGHGTLKNDLGDINVSR